jgi:hypothetical protein
MSFSKEMNRSLTLVLFTLWPGHEIDVEISVQWPIPNLHDALVICGTKVVTCAGLASKLAQRRICDVKQGLVPDPTAPLPLGSRLQLHFIWQWERPQHGREAQHVMREEPALAGEQSEHIALHSWQH